MARATPPRLLCRPTLFYTQRPPPSLPPSSPPGLSGCWGGRLPHARGSMLPSLVLLPPPASLPVPLLRCRRLLLALLPPSRARVGGAEVAAIAVDVETVSLTHRRRCSQVLLRGADLLVGTRRHGHLSTTRGRGPCGLSRLPAVQLLARRRPCSLVLLQGLFPHLLGPHLPPYCPGLSVGARRPWPTLSAP